MLYHKDIWIPDTIKFPVGLYKLKYSGHARRAAQTDRYGDFSSALRYHQSINTDVAEVIEVESFDGVRPTKIVYRQGLTGWDNYDIVFVVIPGEWVVKTVWINDQYDKHTSLKKGKYVSLPRRA